MASRRVHLEVLEIADPCTEDWNAMRGDDVSRFCRTCHHNVYDLSSMTRDAAEQLVSQAEGRVCVRFYKRADGTVTTVDCAPDRTAAMRRTAKRGLALAGAAMAGMLTIVGGLGITSLVYAGAWVAEVTADHPDEAFPMMGVVALPDDSPSPPVEDVPEPDTEEEIEDADGTY